MSQTDINSGKKTFYVPQQKLKTQSVAKFINDQKNKGYSTSKKDRQKQNNHIAWRHQEAQEARKKGTAKNKAKELAKKVAKSSSGNSGESSSSGSGITTGNDAANDSLSGESGYDDGTGSSSDSGSSSGTTSPLLEGTMSFEELIGEICKGIDLIFLVKRLSYHLK